VQATGFFSTSGKAGTRFHGAAAHFDRDSFPRDPGQVRGLSPLRFPALLCAHFKESEMLIQTLLGLLTSLLSPVTNLLSGLLGSVLGGGL